MSKPIIQIKNIGKKYRIGGKRPAGSLAAALSGLFSRDARRERSARETFWALKDVSFDVDEGDVFGVIGKNGAGKSTLLKILSRITPPTEGRITMRGRVASLLEVGTGFHPELTGRENVYLNGAVLGMSRTEITRKFDEIVAFAGVEQFLDTPVKRYSSGMYVRLAFAVAAHLEPEILVVDEVLSVGDTEFQAKCLGKMSEVSKSGRTVLFVSHNLAAVSQLCTKGVVLAGGKIDFLGSSQDAVKQYMAGVTRRSGVAEFATPLSDNGAPARFLRVYLTNTAGEVADTVFIGDEVHLNFDIMFTQPVKAAQIGFIVRSLSSGNIYHCITRDAGFHPKDLHGEVTFTATFPSISLYPGEYVITDLSVDAPTENLEFIQDVLCFQVAEGGTKVHRYLSGHAAVVHEVPEWRLKRNGLQLEELQTPKETVGSLDSYTGGVS